MESQTFPQCKIVPIQMLKPDNAEKFLDGLSCIAGIRRLLVNGPGYVKEAAAVNPFMPCSSSLPPYAEVRISDLAIRMHVLMGDVVVEAVDEQVLETVTQYCSDFFDDIGFQILVGTFIKTENSLSDYIQKEAISDKDLIGLSDFKHRIDPAILPLDATGQCMS